MRVTVVVLGDLGRSPRMQYHAEALAAHQIDVDVVARAGSALHRAASRPSPHHLSSVASGPRGLAAAGAAGAGRGRAGRRADAPPSFPVPGRITQARRDPGAESAGDPDPPGGPRRRPAAPRAPGGGLAQPRLDGARAGARRAAIPLIALARAFETALGRRADAHLCVSEALRQALQARWRIRPVTVFRDRPAERFAPLTAEGRRAQRRRLFDTLGFAASEPALIVSPTSWTRDEDFDLLLDAVRRCDALLADRAGFPDLLVLLTGRGPRRARYEAALAALPGAVASTCGRRGSSPTTIRTRWPPPTWACACTARRRGSTCR